MIVDLRGKNDQYGTSRSIIWIGIDHCDIIFRPRYPPRNAQRDAEQIVDRVTARLSHANASVVMSAIKVILTYMDHIQNAETVKVLTKKLTPPLVTLLSSEPELQYVALRNICLIAQKRPAVVTTDVKM